MQVIDTEQGSKEWHDLRSTIPTASQFHRILTPTGKTSTQIRAYANQLLASWLIGHRSEDADFSTAYTERGNELESEAVALYEMRYEDVQRVGFCLADNGLCGCSPDGLIGDMGGLELKCPKASTQLEYLLGAKLPTKYIPQVQGSLMVTGRRYWDFMSYHPEMESLTIRVQRDENYIAALAQSIKNFDQKLTEGKNRLIELGYKDAS